MNNDAENEYPFFNSLCVNTDWAQILFWIYLLCSAVAFLWAAMKKKKNKTKILFLFYSHVQQTTFFLIGWFLFILMRFLVFHFICFVIIIFSFLFFWKIDINLLRSLHLLIYVFYFWVSAINQKNHRKMSIKQFCWKI